MMSRDPNQLKREITKENILVGISGVGRESESFKPKNTDLEGDYCMNLKTKIIKKNDDLDGTSLHCFCLA